MPRREIKDDRIIYLAVRYKAEAVFVEGGFNGEFDFLPKKLKAFALRLAFEALLANGIAIDPDNAELRKWFEDHTDLGAAGGPTWRNTPSTPPDPK